jgi:dTDP-D-glucose 4,6-dehydratase
LIPIPYSYRAPESYVETNVKGTLNLCQAALKGVYGPRQSARAVIPTIISQIAAGAKEVKLGNLTTTRDFTRQGFTHVTLAVNHQANILKAFFEDGSKWGVHIDYSLEKTSFSDRALL